MLKLVDAPTRRLNEHNRSDNLRKAERLDDHTRFCWHLHLRSSCAPALRKRAKPYNERFTKAGILNAE